MKTADLKFTLLCDEIDQLKDKINYLKTEYIKLNKEYNAYVEQMIPNNNLVVENQIDIATFGSEQMINKIKSKLIPETIIDDFERLVQNIMKNGQYCNKHHATFIKILGKYKESLIS